MDTFLSLLGLAAFFVILGIVIGGVAGVLRMIAIRVSERDRREAEARRSQGHAQSGHQQSGHSPSERPEAARSY